MKPTAFARSTAKFKPAAKAWRLRPLCLAVCLAGLHLGSGAAPQGANIVFGQVQLQGGTNRLDIKQGSDKAIIDWKSFSLQSGELVRIEQPSSTAVLLNRVVGADPSLILGRIEANGRVFLTNPRGILFGSASQVDAGGFLASTLSLSNENFLSGRYQLTADTGSTPGKLQADGLITSAGTIALVAPELSVGGTVHAQRVGLAAASSVLVDVEGDGLIFFNARNDGLQARLDVLGTVRADGGTAELRAQARAGFADTVLNMDGIVQARSLGRRNGQVVIDGGSEGVTSVTGQIDVSGRGTGETGGSASVFGRYVGLSGQASVDASGTAAGGSIRVGGDFHGEGALHNAQRSYLGADTVLNADALDLGSGGRIVVWSDEATRFVGRLSARGGVLGGDGGFAEVSGKQFLDYRGVADLGAPLGRVGSLLLDPLNLTIQATGPDLNGNAVLGDDLNSPNIAWNANSGASSIITAGAVKAQLNNANVVLEASNDITISAAIDGASNANTHSLTLSAGNNITVSANISTKGDLTLSANHSFNNGAGAASGTGAILLGSATVSATGNLTLNAQSITPGTATLSAQNVSLVADTLVLPAITASGTIGATATVGGITQAGAISTGLSGSNFTVVAGQSIDLSTQANSLAGVPSHGDSFLTGANLSLRNVGNIELSATTLTGKLVLISDQGSISQTGVFNVGADGNGFTAANLVSLAAANVFNGTTVSVNSGGDATLSGDALKFGTSTVGGKLLATANTGGISQSGVLSLGADGSSFTTVAADQAITLTLANLLQGTTVALNTNGSSGDASITADALRFGASTIGGKLVAVTSTGTITQNGLLDLGADGNSFTTSAANQAITLTSANLLHGKTVSLNTNGASGDASLSADALKFDASTIGGKLVAVANTGTITQTGVLDLGADGNSFTTSAADQAITLTSANLLHGASVALNTNGSSGDVSLTADALKFDTSTLGGKLTAVASTGTITQTGVLDLGADGNSFTTSGANQAITLNSANLLHGTSVALHTNGSSGDASITADALKFDTSTLGGKLVAVASTGTITQTGVLDLSADGNSFTTSGANQAITLNSANLLHGTSVALRTNGSSGDASITADALKFGASALGGKLIAVASTGTITQTGVLDLGADGNSFTTSTADQAITLTAANLLHGSSVALATSGASGDASLAADALKFGSSTLGGKLLATANTGDITQTGAISTGVSGSVFTVASGQSIDLSTQANSLAGVPGHADSFVTTVNLGLRNVAGIDLGATTLSGKLVLVSDQGSISQSGLFNVGADGSSFTASATGQTVNLTAANVFNGKTVAVNSGGDAALNGTALKFDASTVGGKLVAVASTGGITQTGALNLGADGNSFMVNGVGQAITLTAANVLNGKTVALSSTGDASLTADALKFNASTIGGKLVAVANTGGITQAGALTLGADGNSITTSGAGQAITLTAANVLNGKTVALSSTGDASLSADALKFDASTVGGKLVAVANTGGITQVGALTLGADGNSFTTHAANQTITLTAANLLNGHSLALTTSGASGDASVTADVLAFDASTVGGKLVAIASTGAITQTGALDLGADGNRFTTSTANQTITLGAANLLHGKTVALTTSGAGGDASLTADALKFNASTIGGKLIAVASTGTITQAGVLDLGADGNSFSTSAANQAITLTQANVLHGNSVALATSGASGDASITADALKFGVSTVGGRLTAVASSGGISQSGALTTGVSGSSFSVSTAGQSIDLSTAANSLAGLANGSDSFHTLADLGLRNLAGINLGATTVSGKLVLVSDLGTIAQTGAFNVGADGSSFTASATGQTVNLTAANVFNGKTVAVNSAGDATLSGNALKFATSTVGGKLVATASTGSITQTGALTLGADGNSFTTSAAGQAITLTQANVLNGKTLTLSSSGDVSMTADALKFSASTIGGKLVAIANTGGITQTGALNLGADGNSFTTSGSSQAITLTAANVLNGKTVALSSTGDASLTADALKFNASTVGGKLTAVASTGTITQIGALDLGADGNSFTTSAAGQAITLTQANVLNGKTVALSSTGDASITADALKFNASTVGGKLIAVASTGTITQTGALDLGADGNSFTTSGAGQAITLTQTNVLNGKTVTLSSTGDASLTADALKFNASTIGGKLIAVASTGTITQTGALDLGADGNSFSTSGANQAITLTQANALHGKSVAFNTSGSAGDASITADALKFATSTVGGKLTAAASSGGIGQSGAISVGADGSSFSSSGAGQSLDLGSSNNLFNGKTVSLASAGDARLKADAIHLSSATAAGKLVLEATSGGITQTGILSAGADGNSFTTDTAGQAITLGLANVLNGKTVAVNSGGDAVLKADSLQFTTSTVGGKLVATASTGSITQTGALTLGADGNSFTTSAAGQAITLTQANVLNGKTLTLSSSGDVSMTADALKFSASTIGGKLVAIANTGGITQTGALNLGADGNSFTTSGSSQAITLTAANVLNGKTVALSSTGDASLTADALKFNASTVGGKLTAVASTGTITQIGALDLGADGNSFTTSAAGQAITLTQANVLNGKTVALSSTGDASITADALKFNASTVGGKLIAVASTGTITQTGALDLGADGNSFTTSGAGQAITLTQTNVLNGKTVTLSSTGDASLTADALKFNASTIGGKLIAVASTGTITQTGALDLGADGNSFSTSGANQAITLTQANALHGKSVAFNTSGSAGDASITADALKFATSTVGGKLTAAASSGGIGQSGAISVGADGSSFSSSGAGQSLDLGSSNNLFNGKTVSLASAGDARLKADAIHLSSATAAGKLVLEATSGGITQTGILSAGADGNSFTTDTAGQAITLGLANVLNGKTVAVNSGGDAVLKADSLQFTTSTVGGKLVATASTGSITQTGALTLGADGNSFTTSAAGQAITLTQANVLNGKTLTLSSSGDASLSGDRLLLGASGVGAQLNLAASTSIAQSGALTVGGLTRLTAQGTDTTATLTNAGNQFAGGVLLASTVPQSLKSVALSSAGGLSVAGDARQLTVSSAGAVQLGGGVYEQLTLSAGSSISQQGGLTVTDLLSIGSAGGSALAVDLSSNGAANELKSVRLQVGGAGFGAVQVQDRDLRGDGLLFSGDAASLTALARGGISFAAGRYGSLAVDSSGNAGTIAQSGALQVSGLTTLNAGAGDVLLNQAGNDFSDIALVSARLARLTDANDLRVTQAQVSSSLVLDVPGTVRLSGGLTGAGSLVKNGSGVLLVESGLSNLGGTSLQAGSLVMQGPAASLGPGDLILGNTATLDLRDGAIFANKLISDGGLIRNSSGHASLVGALTLAADTVLDVQAGANLRLLGAVDEQAGAQALVKRGGGLLQLSGSDTRSGATRIEQGQLLADGASALSGLSAMDVAAGARLTLGQDQRIGSLSGGGAVELAAYRLSSGGDQRSSEFAGSLSGSGGLSKTGTGSLTLSGSNSQSGATLLQGGQLILAQGRAQADNAALAIAPGAALVLAADETIGALSGAGAVQLAGQRLTVGADGADSSFGGTIGGSGALSKTGGGALTLAGSGSWDGETRVLAGGLVLASATALPANNGLALSAGALLELSTPLSLGALNGAGTVQLHGNALSLGAGGAGSQFAGSIAGSGGLNKLGGGTLLLSGSNSFTGPVAVTGGVLSLSGGAALADSVGVDLAAGTTLQLQAGETLARVTGGGLIQLDNSARLALGRDGTDSLFAGQIQGSGSLAKQGGGTMILTGENGYAGGTAIEGGTLQIGQGGSSGSLGSGAVDNRGLLRYARSDEVLLANAIGGTGGLELAQGRLTLSSAQNSYNGATTVAAGELLTSGAERLSDASAVKVAAGAKLTVAGNETVASLVADGSVTLRGNLSSAGEQRYRGGLSIDSATGIKLQASTLEALSTANKLGSQALSITANTVQLLAPQDLTLGTVQLAQGGQISAERLNLQGGLTLTGGSLSLIARAAPDDSKAAVSATAFVPGTGKSLALAEDTVSQAAGSSLNVASGAELLVSALGSVNLAQDANAVAGSISVLSGPAFNTAWAPNVRGAVAVQGIVWLAGQQLNVGGAGIEADIVEVRASQLGTQGTALLAARLPFDNLLLGTTLSRPSMVLELLPSAFNTPFSFGSSTDGLRVSVGARSIGGRVDGLDSGYLTVLPKGGAQGATAIFLLGPEVGGAGYSFFHDGAGKQGEIPVFYNNVLPAVPQVASALSSVAAVSESARRDRFEEAVRTENVTSRLRAGVIAEVGPGRAATVGSGAAQPPLSCPPKEGSLSCTP